MKILYGVQATGNGHITRARELVPKLRAYGFDVDVLLSGREREKLFGLDDFGHYRTRRGFTFALDDGRVNLPHTLWNADLRRFWRDVRALNVADYDLIISDFEPVCAWAARLNKRECIGLGHQYALNFPVPKPAWHPAARMLLRWFAPASTSLGMHWDSFGAPILPPIVDTRMQRCATLANSYLVYLPFDNIEQVLALLAQYPQYNFVYYCAVDEPIENGHILQKPYSRMGFQQDLAKVEGVICGAGFELPSEALFLGKKLLVQPLQGQFEQMANAKALQLLAGAQVMYKLKPEPLPEFFAAPRAAAINYPDVAEAIAQWLAAGRVESVAHLSQRLWQQVDADRVLSASSLSHRMFQGW